MSSSTDTPHPLSVITIIVYVALILPTFYIWRRHGRPGFLAYNFVYAFCAIRIAGSAVSIAAERNASLETAAAIVNSIAISPLLLATLGVLHEARRARVADLYEKREWRGVWCLHGVVTTGMVLVIVGIVKAVEGDISTSEAALVKAGMGFLAAAYVVLLLWTIVSLRQPFLARNETLMDGTILLRSTLFALPFIGIRLVDGVLSSFLPNAGSGHSWEPEVGLSFVPEVAAIALFVIGGIRTRNMYASRRREIPSKA